MREFLGIFWTRSEAKLRKFSSSGTAKSTIVKIEIEITDPGCLSSMMRALQEAARPAPPPRSNKPADQSDANMLPPPRLALPSFQLKLEDRRGE